jgi:ATP-dependent helicase IRC3
MKPRPYQQRGIDKIKEAWYRGVNRQLIHWATGLGKGALFSMLPEALNLGSDRMLVVAHREELIDQAVDKLKEWNPKTTVGVEMGERRCSPSDQIVVASVQTLGRSNSNRIQQFNPGDFRIVVQDECHHSASQTYMNVLRHFRVYEDTHRLCVGLTATPNRMDGKGLGAIFQEIVDSYGIFPAVKDGWLTKPCGKRIRTNADLNSLKTLAGDFSKGELSGTVNTPQQNDLTVRAWLEHADGLLTIVYCVDVEHVKELTKAFKGYGVAAEGVWGDDPDRADKVKYHMAGQLKVLINCELLTEGHDDWRVQCIVNSRPTQSEGLYTQIIGRGTRIPKKQFMEGYDNLNDARAAGVFIPKETCLVLDMVGNTSRHSLVTLPSLFGMSHEMDLKGKSVVEAVEKLEELKQKKPSVDFSKVTEIDKLEAYAEQVDLFKVEYTPEILQFSQFMWHKVGQCYVLLLLGGESLTVMPDLLDRWHIVGSIKGCEIQDRRDSLEEAIREADAKIQIYGNKKMALCAQRKMKMDDGPPSATQLLLCKRVKVDVPPGATFGDIRRKLNQRFEELNRWRKNKRTA